MNRKTDVIIIGAGPAGLTAALVLARAGFETIVLERGSYAGSKNMFGGVLFSKGLEQLLPEFWKEAPVERPVGRWIITFLNLDSSFSLDFDSAQFLQSPYNAFTIRRARFDRWFAGKAAEAGAKIIYEVTVDDLILEQGRVAGVKTDREGGLYADVVIAADGVNSVVARKSGLRGDVTGDEVSLGVKELLEIPAETIEKTLGLSPGEGMAQTIVGAATGGICGGGFIYVNRKSISVGLVMKLSALAKSGQRPDDLLESYKHHPRIWPILKDGILREYSAHLIPEGGALPPLTHLYADGLLVTGDAAGFTLNSGVRVEGANYAIMSGIAAAESIKKVAEKKDFSKQALSIYPELLKEYGVMADLQRFRRAARYFKNTRLYQVYPEVVAGMAKAMFSVEPGPKKGLFSYVSEGIKGRVSYVNLIKDAIATWRALG